MSDVAAQNNNNQSCTPMLLSHVYISNNCFVPGWHIQLQVGGPVQEVLPQQDYGVRLCHQKQTCLHNNLISTLTSHVLHAQEELPLQDTGACAPPSGAQWLCLQPHKKQYGRRTASQSGPHRHPQPSTPNIQVAGSTCKHGCPSGISKGIVGYIIIFSTLSVFCVFTKTHL